jgi:eukaryotic-like serine/threonine-protein kinase
MTHATPLFPPEADRNLLFGVLALQAGLIDTPQLAEVCTAWAAQRRRPLAELLVERGWLSPEARAEIERALEREARQFGGDGGAGFSGLTTNDQVRTPTGPGGEAQHRDRANPQPPLPLRAAADPATDPSARYTLTRLHATGGIGRVWVARDPTLGREVALKELRPERAENPLVWARFLQEAKVTGQLEHPGIVPIYELGWRPQDQQPFYTMRFVRGGTLRAAIKAYHRKRAEGSAGALDLRGLLDAFVAVCNAVAFAHSRGVIHRDLKPANVVLGDFGEVIVLDWGLAKIVGDPGGEASTELLSLAPGLAPEVTMDGQVLGTPAYMAPEQAAGRLDLMGLRTDVYGLGAILYELLTGQPPFSGEGTEELLRQVREVLPPPPRRLRPDVPPALEAVCVRALAKHPDDRYPSAEELAREVKCWLADEPVAAYPEPLRRRLARWARHHKGLVGTAAAALLTAFLALAGGLVLLGQEQARTEQERQEAVAARKQADVNAAAAEAARRRADASAAAAGAQRQLALETLQILVTDVQEQLEDTPGNHRLKQELLATALTGLERLASSAERSKDADLPLIDAHQRMGAVFLLLGRHDRARAQFERARALAEALLRADPRNRGARRELGRALRGLGEVSQASGRVGEAQAHFRKAVDLLRTLHRSDPKDRKVRRELAQAHYQLGEVAQDLGAGADARKHYREALRLAEQAAAADDKDVQARVDMAVAQGGLAQVVMHEGDVPASAAWARKGLEVLGPLLAGGNRKHEVTYGLALCELVLGNALWKGGSASAARKHIARSLELHAALAAADPNHALRQRELSVAHNWMGDVLLDLGAVEEARKHYRTSVAVMQKVLASVERRARLQQDLAQVYTRLGRANLQAGKIEEAWDCLRKCPGLLEALLAEDGSHVETKRDLGIVYELLGQVSIQKADSPGARAYFRKSIALAKERVAADPKAVRWRRDLGIAYQKAAEAETRLGEVAGARELTLLALKEIEAVAAAGRDNAEAQQDLALSHRWAADAEHRAGNRPGALRHARQSLETLEALVGADPRRTGAKRDLSIAYLVLGELHADGGERDAARSLYAEAIRLSEELLETDREDARFRRDVLVAQNKMGDLLMALGQPGQALGHYRTSFAHAEGLAKGPASSAEARFDLAWGHMRLAEAGLALNRPDQARGDADKAVQVLRPLAEGDPKNADLRTALGSAYLRVGRAARAADAPAARAAFTEAARTFGALVKAHPEVARFQRDLLIAYNNQGDVCLEVLNDRPAAGSLYRQSFALAEALAHRYSDSLEDQTNLVLGLGRLGQHALQGAKHAAALRYYDKALAVVRRLDKQGRLQGAPVYLPRAPAIERQLTLCRFAQRGARDLEFVLAQPPEAAKALLVQRAQILTREGKHADAAQAAEKLRELGPNDAAVLFDVARCYALCAVGVAPGKKAGELSKEELAERGKHVARAVEALGQAVERGFRNLPRLEADSDLAGVRAEPGYREVVERLKRGK